MGIIMFEVIVMSDIVFMFVRLASMVDVPVLELLDCGCFPVGRLDVEPAGVGELVGGVESGLVFVVEDEGVVVGFCQLCVDSGGGVFEVLSVCVDGGFRGSGVGRLLLSVGVGELVRLGAGVVKCVTAPSNVRMRGLLGSFGFELQGLVVDYYGDGKDRLVYEFAV
jgi:ribosomal protein S18 acetylase RimI-like enzyme